MNWLLEPVSSVNEVGDDGATRDRLAGSAKPSLGVRANGGLSSLHLFGQCPPWSKGLIERQVGGPTERPFMARNGYADAFRFGNNVSKLS